ncbi:Vacuolar protein sorting-associated protein 53, partial [Lobosporangium transversale]
SVFKPGEEVSALDNTSRRYAWLKRLLKIHDEEHSHVFPAAWDAVLQLIQYFRTFQNVRQIAELTESVAKLQVDLERDIVKDFEHGFTKEGILIGNIGQLSSACLVIDILGEDV